MRTRRHILIAEDEALVRLGLQAMISGWGYQAVTAEGGAEALRLVERHQPDIILADYRLRNDETGPEVIQAVQAHLGRSIPAAIITGDTAPERLAEAQAAGHKLLHKPVAASELNRMLASLMQRSRRTGLHPLSAED